MLRKLIASGIILSGLIILIGCDKAPVPPAQTASPAPNVAAAQKPPATDWSGWGEPGHNLRCKITADKDSYPLGQPIKISGQVANDSDRPNYISSYGSYVMEEEKTLRSGFEFKLTDKAGREIKPLYQGSFDDNTSRRDLKPGEIIDLFQTDLNIWYDLSRPGEYIFQVFFLNDHFNNPDSLNFASNKLPLVITAGPATGINRAAEELNIAELVLRHLFEHNASGLKKQAAAFCLNIFGADPTPEFLARFKDQQPPVKPASQWIEGKDLQFRVSSFKWIDDKKVELRGGYHEGDESGSSATFHISRKDGIWVIDDITGNKIY